MLQEMSISPAIILSPFNLRVVIGCRATAAAVTEDIGSTEAVLKRTIIRTSLSSAMLG
jgi:hypothetical protein